MEGGWANDAHPRPPSPAFTTISAWSTNHIRPHQRRNGGAERRSRGGSGFWLNADGPRPGKANDTVLFGVESPVPAGPDVPAGLEDTAALPHEDRAGAHPLASEPLDPEPASGAIAPVLGGPGSGFMRHRRGSLRLNYFRFRRFRDDSADKPYLSAKSIHNLRNLHVTLKNMIRSPLLRGRRLPRRALRDARARRGKHLRRAVIRQMDFFDHQPRQLLAVAHGLAPVLTPAVVVRNPLRAEPVLAHLADDRRTLHVGTADAHRLPVMGQQHALHRVRGSRLDGEAVDVQQ